MKYSCVVVAAGVGSRTGLNYNKVFYKLDNKTVIEHSLKHFIEDEDCLEIILVINKNEIEDFRDLNLDTKVRFEYGGDERQDSVYNGLRDVETEYVMIHDGARPYLSKENLDSLKRELANYDATLLMVRSIDTSKIVKDNLVVKTLDRTTVYNAQTPQAFKTKLIKTCYQEIIKKGIKITDDIQAVELTSNTKIKVVEGDYKNIKITVKEDLKNE